MNRPLVLILAVLLAAVTAAVLFLLGGDSETELEPSGVGLEAGEEDEPRSAARRGTFDDEPEMEIERDAVEGGLCEVSGRVVDRESRRPLVGASLTVRLVDGDSVTTSDVASAKRGRFRFEGLEPTGEGWLVAAAADRGTRVLGPFRLAAGDALDVGDVALGPGGRVWGRVVGPGGGGVPGAEVALREVAPPRLDELLLGLERMFERRPPAARAVTDAEGRYEIPGVPRGVWHAAVTAPGHASLHRTDVWINGRGLPTRLDFRLVRGERLRGRVVRRGPGGERAVAQARVCVVPALNGRDLSIIVRRHHAVTDADGRFELDSLEAGDVEVLVNTPDGRFERKRRVIVPNDDLVVNLGEGRDLEGSVTIAGSGAPLAGVEVVVTEPSSMASTVTGADGSFALPALRGREWKFHVTHPEYVVTDATRRLRVKGEDVVHHIEVERGFTARGRVLDVSTGRPIAGAIVFAPRDDMAGLTRAKTDRKGRFELRGVKPGRHRILARSRGYGFNPEDQRRRHPEVEGASGDAVDCADILLARAVRVRGQVVTLESGRPLPVIGARVTTSPYGELQARMLGTRSENTVSDREGRFELDSSWTVDGFLHVRASHPDLASQVVVAEGVTPDQVVDVVVEMDRGVAVEGLVRRADGQPVHGARVTARFNSDQYDVHHEQLRERFGFLARTDSQGRYSLRLPRTAGYFVFERTGHVQLTPGPLPYDPGPGASAFSVPDVVFARSQRFFGRVAWPSGAAYEEPVAIAITRASQDGLPWTISKRFPSGSSFAIRNVPRGIFDVVVRDADGKELVKLSGARSGARLEILLP